MLTYGVLIKNYKPQFFYIDFLRAFISFTIIFVEFIHPFLFWIYITFILCLQINLIKKYQPYNEGQLNDFETKFI